MRSKLIAVILLSLAFVGSSYANPSLSVEEKKIVLEYKQTLESHIAKKVELINGGEGVVVKVNLKTILSSEKIKNLNKDLLLPISAIGGPSFNKIFVDQVNVKVTTLNELTPKSKRLAIIEISEILNMKSPDISFRVAVSSGYNLNLIAYAGITIVFIIASFSFFWIKKKEKSSVDDGELNKDESIELELMLEKLTQSLKGNVKLLNEYMNTREYDISGFSTLVLYLEMKFKKEILFDPENLNKLSKCSSYYTSREFKIWLGAIINTLELQATFNEDTVGINNVFDFEFLSTSSIDELKVVLIDLTDRELSIFFNSVPNKLKFKMIEALRENRGSDMDSVLGEKNSGHDYGKDLELLSKVERKIQELKKMNEKDNTHNAA
ncbi:MAG: hypothetical protein ACJAS4_000438 [Bacteriovoracaceae bacterium]|jgi:hypothetical protein